ncbi:NAD(P)-binding protein [Thermosipho ferrireducens]|uniref:NAD(P)-binding protein n=1 Tax=Thermosipho ferrireducens TaxID=2571116 RepID=A0ABX7S7C9_9BACT|nr:NAD(P)-binding protein [Thermosipho ferrireducens]QTA38497.1 NAD(P)-binding protein [Thermosipho ferrireducens]
MKICIIGAGITGLSVGKLLSNDHDVTIYEKKNHIGGIAYVKDVNGVAYHLVGGHCLNSKNQKVLDFIFNKVLPKENWHIVKRISKIYFRGHYISYPIEFSVKEIATFDKDLAFNITKDFFEAKFQNPQNLAEWFEQKFGKTLAHEYFIPYNRKIWNMAPEKMDYLWVKDKLPIPNKRDFFESLIGVKRDIMPHNVFYYPNTNSQNTFIEALAKDLKVINNFEVFSIEKRNNKWIVNNQYEYDIVISTVPLNMLPFIVKNVPVKIKDYARKLKYNKVTTVLWKTKPIKFTWTYYPAPDTIFHRHIHIGNFFQPMQNYTITESIGERSYEEMVSEGRKFDYLLEPLDYHVSDHAYVVFDHNYKKSKEMIKEYFQKIGIFSIGRFGEWEYYNMDVCIEKAMELVERINRNILLPMKVEQKKSRMLE